MCLVRRFGIMEASPQLSEDVARKIKQEGLGHAIVEQRDPRFVAGRPERGALGRRRDGAGRRLAAETRVVDFKVIGEIR